MLLFFKGRSWLLGHIYPLITTSEPLETLSVSRVFSVKYSIVFRVFKIPTPCNRQNPKVYISRQEILFIHGPFENQNKCTYSNGKGDVLY